MFVAFSDGDGWAGLVPRVAACRPYPRRYRLVAVGDKKPIIFLIPEGKPFRSIIAASRGNTLTSCGLTHKGAPFLPVGFLPGVVS